MRRLPFGAVVLAGVAGVLAFTVPASTQGPGRPGREMVDGREAVAREALVRFLDPLAAAALAELRNFPDVENIERIGGAGVVRVRSRAMDAATLVAQLSQRPDVLYAEPNYIVRAFSTPTDVSFPQLWGLENIGQSVNGGLPGTAGSDIRAVPAWNVSVGSTAHVVGVIDTGIDYTHPDLAPNMWSAPAAFSVDLGDGTVITCAAGSHGFNAITRACNPMDDHGHGTHVAGTIGAAGNNGIGVVGVNWTARLMGIKFLDAAGSGTIADAIAAIRFASAARLAFPAAGDVRVLSASWGGSGFSQALLDEITVANGEEMLLVAAAGNSGLNNDTFPTYPASYPLPNIIAVAATTNANGRAYFSNYGPTSVHLGAPGADILSTYPGNRYSYASGTSMATPHVSGAAALVLSRCALDTADLKDALIGTVQPMEALASTTVTGGRLDVHSAIHSCIAPPPAPVLTAIGGDSHTRLSWESALGATGYIVKRSLAAGGPYATIASAVKGARFTDSSVVNGTTYFYVVSATNLLGESADSNEASATPNAPSDLTISAFTAPGAAGAGTTISVATTTTNQGVGPSAPTMTRVYLSLNAVVDTGDLALEPAHTVPGLASGVSSTASLSLALPPDLETGTRYLIAVADADRVADETSEWNNTRLRLILIGGDLRVSAFSVPAKSGAGRTIVVSDTTVNEGTDGVTASATRFYLSPNALLDASDTPFPTARAVPALAAGASSSGSTSLAIPAGVGTGTYYLFAKADGDGTVVEAKETNNTSLKSILIGPDLVVSSLAAPSEAAAGHTLSVTDTTANQGGGDVSPSSTTFFLSGNYMLDASDTPLDGTRTVSALAVGASNSGSTSLTIPTGTAPGTYYLIARADGGDEIVETLETNNTRSRSIRIGPDLVVSYASLPTSSIQAGATATVSTTVRNQGTGTAAPSTIRFYLSSNGTLDGTDILVSGSRDVPELGADATSSGSTVITIPADTPVRTYYVLAIADADGTVAESSDSNNVRIVRSITVTQ
jgi:subtilisin family serine protease